MGIFDFSRKKRKVKAKRKKRSRKSPSKTKQAIEKTRVDIQNLQGQLRTINIVLSKHNDELLQHKKLIAVNSKGLEKLEQIVAKTKIEPPAKQTVPTTRPTGMINPPILTKPHTEEQVRKFDINRFSEQEKRILAVFFQNQGMALSYVDIAKALNKSPHTVKNQMRQMRLKAELFERSVDNDSRNRFKFKDRLKVEKYLNVG